MSGRWHRVLLCGSWLVRHHAMSGEDVERLSGRDVTGVALSGSSVARVAAAELAVDRLLTGQVRLGVLLGEILAVFGRLVPSSEVRVIAFDPDALLPMASAASESLGEELAFGHCRNELLERDVLKLRDLASSGSHVGSLSRTAAEAKTSARWSEFLIPRGIHHELRASLVSPRGQCWGALLLYRDRGPAFSEADNAFVEKVAPELADGLARAVMFERAADGGPCAPGTLVLTLEGALVWATPGGQRWLEALDREGDAASGLARAAGAAIAARAARLARGFDGDGSGSGAASLRLRDRAGRWVSVHAELVERDDLEPRISVVIEPARSGVILPLAADAYGLTEREREVTRGVLRGHATKVIARELSVTPWTVQDHLKSVFEKVGVRSRQALAYELALQNLSVRDPSFMG